MRRFAVITVLLTMLCGEEAFSQWRDSARVIIPSPSGKAVKITQFAIGDTNSWKTSGALAYTNGGFYVANGSYYVRVGGGSGSTGNSDSLGGVPASDYARLSVANTFTQRNTFPSVATDTIVGRSTGNKVYVRDTLVTRLGIKYYDSNNDLRLNFFGETGEASGIVFYNSDLASQILQSGDGYIESLGSFYVRNAEAGNSALNVGGAIGQTQPVLNVEQGDSLILRVLPTNRVLIGETTDDSMLTVELGGHFYRGLKVDGATSLGSLSLGTDLTLANIDTSGTTGLRSICVPYSGANASVNLGAQTLTTTGLFSGGAITATGLMTLGSSGSAQSHQISSSSANALTLHRNITSVGAASGLNFAGNQASGAQVTYGTIQGLLQSSSNSIQSGGLIFATRRAGSEVKAVIIDSMTNMGLQIQNTSTLSDSRFWIRSSGLSLYALSVIPAASTTKLFTVDTNGVMTTAGAGYATIGAGDSVQVTIAGLTTATGSATVSYKRKGATSVIVADTIPSWDITTADKLTLYGKYGWVVSYIIGKK